jgi:hypothetical protein
MSLRDSNKLGFVTQTPAYAIAVAIMQSTTVKTRAENSELLLKNFAIPGKSVAMPDGQDICQKDRESDRRLPDLAHDGTSRKLFE